MRIIAYEDRYRDDLIFMILEAKNALGRVPGLKYDEKGIGDCQMRACLLSLFRKYNMQWL